MLSIAPQLDLIQGIELFFNIAQRTIDVNREFAGRWAELVGSLTAVILEQAEPDDQLSTEDVVHTGNDGRRGGIDTVIDDPAPVDAR
jgi:hypothetical protein